MATIVTRDGKGAALTHTELDANFTNLNSDKVEAVSSSTDNAIPRFNGTEGVLQNSSVTISDDGDIVVGGTTPTVTIGDAGAEDAMLAFDGNALDFHIALDDTADDLVIGTGTTAGANTLISINGDASETKFNQPKVTIGDATAEDVMLAFDGNALDFHVGLDDSEDDLVIGTGTTLGANTLVSINGDASEVKLNVPKLTVGDATAEDTYLIFDGNAIDYRIGLDDGTDALEIGAGAAHGTTSSLTIDSSGHVTQIGQDSFSSGDVLTYDGSKFVGEAPTTGDITSVTAGALLDNGGTTGDVTLDVDLTEAGAQTIVAGDYVLFLDGGTTGSHAKGSVNDVATLFAGTASSTGLSASSGVMSVSDLHPVGVDGAANQLVTDDGDGTVTSEAKAKVDGATMTIGNAAEEDSMLVFDGHAQDYRIGLDDGTDVLEMGVGSTHGTTIALKIDSSANVTIPTKLVMNDVTAGKILVGDGTSYEEIAVGGDATLASDGTLSIAANSIDGTHIQLGSDASGDVMYYNGTNYVRLGKGSDTQVLTLASGSPSWASPASGASAGFAVAMAIAL